MDIGNDGNHIGNHIFSSQLGFPAVRAPTCAGGGLPVLSEQKMGSSLGRSCCSFSKNLAKGLIKVTGWGVGEVGEPQYS